MPLLSRFLPFVACTLAVASPVLAQDAPSEGRWSVGAGGAIFSTPIKGADDVATIVPYVAYEGERLHATPFGASYRLMTTGPFEVSVIAAPRFQLVEPEDTSFLAGMKQRDSTIEGGLSVKYDSDIGQFRLDAMTDLMSRHKGTQVSLKYGFGLQFGNLSVVPSLSATWQDKKLSDYYYGVRPGEAMSRRPAYAVGASLIPGAGLDLAYPLSDKLRLVAIANFEALPKEITRSPIVDEKHTAQLIVGVIRAF